MDCRSTFSKFRPPCRAAGVVDGLELYELVPHDDLVIGSYDARSARVGADDIVYVTPDAAERDAEAVLVAHVAHGRTTWMTALRIRAPGGAVYLPFGEDLPSLSSGSGDVKVVAVLVKVVRKFRLCPCA